MNSNHSLTPFLDQVEGRTILITGANGFVGTSLLRLLAHTKKKQNLQTRIMAQFRQKVKHLNSSVITDYIISSIGQDIDLPTSPDIVFHCATPASAAINVHEPRHMLDLNIQAMDWILNNRMLTKNEPTIVFASSGAVYGPQPDHITHIPETWTGGPNTFSSGIAYAEGKRVAEFLLSEASRTGKVQQSICRLFAFSGVGIPFDRHFAIGNFVKDAIDNGRITVRSDGSSVRSYLDSDDMARWLLMAATKPESNLPYHIGSERAISIAELATLTAEIAGSLTGNSIPVQIQGTASPLDGFKRYVPANQLTRGTLHVAETVNLEQSIIKMFHAYREGSRLLST